jgi:nucleoside-diphosphate-sugar epimerase
MCDALILPIMFSSTAANSDPLVTATFISEQSEPALAQSRVEARARQSELVGGQRLVAAPSGRDVRAVRRSTHAHRGFLRRRDARRRYSRACGTETCGGDLADSSGTRPRQRRAAPRAAHPRRHRRHLRGSSREEIIMRVFVAGANGAIGTYLTRLLIARGHSVIGLIRDPAGAAGLRSLGAEPVVSDALDRDRLLHAVDGLSADAVIHELTALRRPPLRASGMTLTNRLRTEGTANLLAVAERLRARRMVTQSIILGYGYADHGDWLLTEQAPFGRPAGDLTDDAVVAIKAAETQTFTAPEGIALRYGMLYGGDGAQMRAMLAKRAVPVARGGLLGWVHHLDAAAATVAALESGRPGQAYNIVDDSPATWQEVFTAMAAGFRVPRPYRLPAWLVRLIAPYVAAFAVDTSMRVSNAKAKNELGWQPRFPTYHEGIAAMISGTVGDDVPLWPMVAANRR